jgi:hypothetical protein
MNMNSAVFVSSLIAQSNPWNVIDRTIDYKILNMVAY